MTILFLHGWTSVPGGLKPTYLKDNGHEVINPALDDDDFSAAVQTAQAEYDKHEPDVIVGSSRGGAVAMNIESKDTPLVLLCPAWKKWGSATTVKANTTILHSRKDDVVPFENSEELIANSGLPSSALIEIGTDHRLADTEPLAKMLEACERFKPMRIYGLDFTSNPSSSKSGSKKAKLLTLANCKLNACTLEVESLVELNTENEGDYSGFEDWLNARGIWAKEPEWIAGIDFPLGMPVEAVEHFGWLSESRSQTWAGYVAALYRESPDVDAFRDRLESWKKQSRSGSDKRVFLLRRTDKLSGFAGSTPSSPMKVHPQCNPPVGRMFFQGANRLLNSGVCIQPVRANEAKRIVVEAYPRLVADKFIPGGKYKDGQDLSASREAILNGMSKPNEYGFTLSFRTDKHRKHCIEDELGDKLDSVLCAVQAAWSYSAERSESKKDRRTHRYGIPSFTIDGLSKVVALEGWIADPLLLRSVNTTHET